MRAIMLARLAWLATLATLATSPSGCAADETYIIVTVQSRPAVHDASTLLVTLGNAGTTLMDTLKLDGKAFPVTFSVSTPGRTGDLTIQVDALDANKYLVGQGTTTTTTDGLAPNVLLDSADFVVNTEVADDQFPSNDFEAHGFQLAAASDGTWTTTYRDKCLAPCNMFARRFDSTGRALSTKVAASANAFPVSTNLTLSSSTPAIATGYTATLAMWDFSEPAPGTASGIACRTLDPMGAANPDQVVVATETSPDVVSLAPMDNHNFAVSWNSFSTTQQIRTIVVRPDCTPVGTPVTASTVGTGPRRAAVASVGTTIMYTWVLDGSVRMRVANSVNSFVTNDVVLVPTRTAETVQHVRVTPFGTGYAVVVRWAGTTATQPGRIEMYRTTNMGVLMGTPIMITDRAGSDFESAEAFGVATRADGMVLVVWQACAENGDGSSCGVFGRAIKPDGTPLGAQFTIPTTTANNQKSPSAVGLGMDAFAVVWKDDSAAEPDHSGSAVRARIIYPQ